MKNKRVKLFGILIDALDMHDTVGVLKDWLISDSRQCRYVVTPNVDHLVKLDKNEIFRVAYQNASLVVADGRPVVAVASMFGDPLPGTVPGSDLVPEIFERFQKEKTPLKVFLLGAMPGVADSAAKLIESKWPMVSIVGTLSPVFGFEKDVDACIKICQSINASNAELLVLGLGAPKQELWVYQYASQLSVKVALCVGATIDFLAGEKPRAPAWMRKFAIEWLHRMASEPKRLAGRYFNDALVFPRLIIKEWLSRR
ncbi:WecB/TagA/CpsF family glycosyltransferase [Methyloradius palustris]|uniref:Acetyl-mannosamine transferase n=1 Tax=Methyloradius palustris TaxID=2778876 RepID=A0A8D5JVL8_9PROT|nr:WecB/TagA/CpsF family glycosyltransferase [Methyloradius palustris]BCM24254.1 acetyl-mannosamine transferase [Methyloradius palustris]